MFKFFAIVFAAILALTSAAPKPGIVAYGSPYVAAAPALAYSAPVAYSGYSGYAAPSVYAASPLAYSAYSAPLAYY